MADQTLQQRLDAATDQIETDSGLFHDVVHGPSAGEGSSVATEGGAVATVAKRLADLDDAYAGAGIVAAAVAARDAAIGAAGDADAALAALNAKITVSTEDPSGGAEGDIWFKVDPTP